MRALLQRVSTAQVSVDDEIVGSIDHGLLILLGVEREDDNTDIDWLVKKISQMRIFSDEDGKMNRSVLDTGGGALVISQFTLHASTKKGNRPSYIKAARPEIAVPMYEEFCSALSQVVSTVERGVFGADMQVSLTNDGPVTIWLDSKNKV